MNANDSSAKPYSSDQIATLRDCMDLFCHRVDFHAANMFDALVEDLMSQGEKLEPSLARQALDCKTYLETDIGLWTDEFGKRLRSRVDLLIDQRNVPDEGVSPPAPSKLSLVDEKDVDVEVAMRVYAQRMASKAGEDLATFSTRLASLLKVPEVTGNQNPFSASVVSGATSDALTKVLNSQELVTLCLRTLTRVVPLDLASVYRDLDQFLEQRGISSLSASRRAERVSRPEKPAAAPQKVKAEELLRDTNLGEQVASALLARVAAMNPAFGAMSPNSVGSGVGGFLSGGQGGQGNMGGQGGMMGGGPGSSFASGGGVGGQTGGFPGGAPGGNFSGNGVAGLQNAGGAQGLGAAGFAGGAPGGQGFSPAAPGQSMGTHFAGGAPEASGQPGGDIGVAPAAWPAMPYSAAGGFPQILPPPAFQPAINTPLGPTVANSPQMAAMALLGAPLPPGMPPEATQMQVVAPQVLGNIRRAQTDVAEAVRQIALPAFASGAQPQEYSTAPLRNLAASQQFQQNASVLDFTTIELVAMVFEYVFRDIQLHDAVKALINHLQIPLLKAALIDRNFFASKTHPGRVLLNRLAEVGKGWEPDHGVDDPAFKTIYAVVNDVARDFENDLSIFVRATERLDDSGKQVEAAAEPEETAVAVIVEKEDKEVGSDAWARRAIRDRLDRAPLPAFAVDFLSGPWLEYVRQLTNSHGTQSEQVQRALDHADLLVDSIKEKIDPDTRRKMISKLPKLLGDLRAGCVAVNASQELRDRFFDQMFDMHTRLFKGMSVDLPESPDGQKETVTPAKVDIELATAPDDMFHEIALGMDKGMWIEMQDDTGKLKLAKLSWVSPQRTTYLFTTRQGHKAASLTPVQLAEWFRDDRARLLDSEPVVDRALNRLLSELVAEPA